MWGRKSGVVVTSGGAAAVAGEPERLRRLICAGRRTGALRRCVMAAAGGSSASWPVRAQQARAVAWGLATAPAPFSARVRPGIEGAELVGLPVSARRAIPRSGRLDLPQPPLSGGSRAAATACGHPGGVAHPATTVHGEFAFHRRSGCQAGADGLPPLPLLGAGEPFRFHSPCGRMATTKSPLAHSAGNRRATPDLERTGDRMNLLQVLRFASLPPECWIPRLNGLLHSPGQCCPMV